MIRCICLVGLFVLIRGDIMIEKIKTVIPDLTVEHHLEISKLIYPKETYHTAYSGQLFVEDNFKNGKCTHGVFALLKVCEYLLTLEIQ